MPINDNTYADDDDEDFEMFKEGLLGNLGPLGNTIDEDDIVFTNNPKYFKKRLNKKQFKSNKHIPSKSKINLLKQWVYCRVCKHCALPREGLVKDNHIYCGKINKYILMTDLKKSKVFCRRGD